MGTACWGTNDTFDCAWVSFGYGSRNDCSMYWIGLEALKALTRLDDIEMGDVFGDNTPEEFSKLSLMRQYTLSSDHIEHEGGLEVALQWFSEIKDLRRYYIKNPDQVEMRKKDEEIRKRIKYFESNSDYPRSNFFHDPTRISLALNDDMSINWTCQPNTYDRYDDKNGYPMDNFDLIFPQKTPEQKLQEKAEEIRKINSDPTIETSWDDKFGDFESSLKHTKFAGQDYGDDDAYQTIELDAETIGKAEMLNCGRGSRLSYIYCAPLIAYTFGGLGYHKGWLQKEVCPSNEWFSFGGELIKNKFKDSNPNRYYKDPEMLNDFNWETFLVCSEWEKLHDWKGELSA
jgi:hypothetical protein